MQPRLLWGSNKASPFIPQRTFHLATTLPPLPGSKQEMHVSAVTSDYTCTVLIRLPASPSIFICMQPASNRLTRDFKPALIASYNTQEFDASKSLGSCYCKTGFWKLPSFQFHPSSAVIFLAPHPTSFVTALINLKNEPLKKEVSQTC